MSRKCQEELITSNHLTGSHDASLSSIQYTSTRFTRGLSVSWNRGVKPRAASSGSSSLKTIPVIGSIDPGIITKSPTCTDQLQVLRLKGAYATVAGQHDPIQSRCFVELDNDSRPTTTRQTLY